MKKIPKIGLGAAAAAVLLLLLDLTGGALAQPEREDPPQDRFIGFHLVYERMPTSQEEYELDRTVYETDRSQWVEYGSGEIQTDGYGTLSIPREILIGQRDTQGGSYIFPGLEGKNCFLAVETLGDGGRALSGYTDMADVQIKTGGEEESVSGTVYFGPPEDARNWNTDQIDYGWTAYRVFQMEDGAVYLDGSGNSYGGVGGFSTSERMEETVREGGEETTRSFSVSVSFASVPRLEYVTVKQFDKDDRLLETHTLTQGEAQALEGGEVRWTLAPGAAYALVTETGADGSAARTIAEPNGDGELYHMSWFLDERGMGYGVPVWLV